MKKVEFLHRVLESDDVVNSIRNNLDKLILIIPEIEPMIGFEHKHPHHHLDVFEHTLLALSKSPKDFDVRLSLLLHDIGKPHCFVEGEVRHFYGHAQMSAMMSRDILFKLGFDKNYIKQICLIVKEHDTPIKPEEIKQNKNWAFKKFTVQICDALAHNPAKNAKRLEYIENTKKLFAQMNNDHCKQ